jgi:two-component system, OmpR family, alkaline phosphatase synthesis response regulator PhoP
MKTILIVDDEKDIVDLLKYNLKKEGYNILTAANGKMALEQSKHQPDLIILDVMMPELNGLEVIKKLKSDQKTASIPVIFLTAKGTELDEVIGFELGADDYIIKPISIPKLIARIKNAFRRHQAGEATTDIHNPICIGVIDIHPAQHTVKVAGREIFFPKKEFEVLLYLAEHAEQVITRETLLKHIWGSDVMVVDRTVDVHIRKIREKLSKFESYIETLKGIGYRMRIPEETLKK